jgi:putative PIG3 family NAD(P)H quinone oxidoreductase
MDSRLPTTMRHVAVDQPGPPEAMHVAEGPVPSPRDGEMLIEVAYAGVNRPDCAQRAGHYPPPADASPILGLEVAGKVAALGSGVSGWAIGDAVCALTPGGGYAQYCTTPAGWALPPPQGVSLLEAASLPENYFTVWHNVFERGHLTSGETFLVHGGSSGIGLTAIQLAKAFGATVFTTVGNDEKARFCRAMGAGHVINYREMDFLAEVQAITGKKGVDLVLDMVGGDYVDRNLRALATEGRLVQIAFPPGQQGHRRLALHHDEALDGDGLDDARESSPRERSASRASLRER